MIKLRLWDALNARKPSDRQITETLKDRDADRNAPAEEAERKTVAPGSAEPRN